MGGPFVVVHMRIVRIIEEDVITSSGVHNAAYTMRDSKFRHTLPRDIFDVKETHFWQFIFVEDGVIEARSEFDRDNI